MMPNKSIYRDADAAEINLYELNFARFFSILYGFGTNENRKPGHLQFHSIAK